MKQQSISQPYASLLRQRAAALADLAAAIESSLVMSLGDIETVEWDGPRARLCDQMLARNLHQLHEAADDLRTTSFRFRCRADEFDAAHRRSAA